MSHLARWQYKEALAVINAHPELKDRNLRQTQVYGCNVSINRGRKLLLTWSHNNRVYQCYGFREFLDFVTRVYH